MVLLHKAMSCFVIISVRCRAYIFLIVINFPIDVLRMRDKCKINNAQRNDKALLV